MQLFSGEWGDDVNKPVDPGFNGEIFLEGHFRIEGFALRLGVGIKFSGDLVDIDADVLYLSTKAGKFFHEVVKRYVSCEDSDGLVVEDGTDEAAQIVLRVLIQEALELVIGGVADSRKNIDRY